MIVIGTGESFPDPGGWQGRYAELAELAGSLAHEIKNPLSVIRLNVDLLAEDLQSLTGPRIDRAIRKVDVVSGQCERLESLLDDFLKFTRLRPLDREPADLNEPIRRVLDLYEPQVTRQNVEIIRYLSGDLPHVMLDEATLQAAIMNLVKNAIEAMPTGGQLVARTRVTRLGVAFDLIDTGFGMDSQTAMSMFEAFFSTKDGGSGLGLPTARRIVEAHGGTISVESQLGVGTKFTLEFPTPARLAGDGLTPLPVGADRVATSLEILPPDEAVFDE